MGGESLWLIWTRFGCPVNDFPLFEPRHDSITGEHDRTQYDDINSHSYAGHGDSDGYYYGYLKKKPALVKKKGGGSCDRHGGVVIVDWRGSSRPGSQRWHHFSRNPLQRCLGGPKGRNGNTKGTCSLLPDGSEFFHRIFHLPLHKSSGESVSSEAPPAAASSQPLANVQVPFTYRAKVAASSPRPPPCRSEQRRSTQAQLATTQWLYLKSPPSIPSSTSKPLRFSFYVKY